MCLQLADRTVHYPTGIAENVPVKIQNFFIPVDFVVLNMEVDAMTPLLEVDIDDFCRQCSA